MLILLFIAGTICWSVAIHDSVRPTLLAIAGNGSMLTLLLLSMQPARIVKAEICLGAAEVPLMSLVLIDRPRL